MSDSIQVVDTSKEIEIIEPRTIVGTELEIKEAETAAMCTDIESSCELSSELQPTYIFSDKNIGLSLKNTLIELQKHISNAKQLKQQGNSTDDLKSFYKQTIIPHILELRRLNREQMLTIDNELQKIEKLSEKIKTISMNTDCLWFDEYLKIMDSEQKIRASACEQLSKVEKETFDVEMSSKKLEAKLETVKPSMKQFVDTVDLINMNSSSM